MPRDLIVFGEDWGRHPSSTQHIVRRLANDRRIIWVNSLGLRRPRLDRRDLARVMDKARALFAKGQASPATNRSPATPHPFAAVVNPRAISWPGSALAATVNRQLLSRQLSAAVQRSGLVRPVIWTSLPTALPVLGALGEHAVVYYAGDDFSALAGVDHQPVARMEAELARRADLVLSASEIIARRFDPAKTQVLPHGVDYARFATPVARADALPAGKVAGFYGSINDWIDIDVIASAARRLPDWSFVLIGRVETDISALQGLANVRILPPMAHGELASFSQHWDVSILPFRRNRQIAASNPLKLREYLAAGRPVAATWRFAAIDAVGGPVCVHPDLAKAIQDAKPMADAVLQFRPELAQETWEARAQTVARLIDAL